MTSGTWRWWLLAIAGAPIVLGISAQAPSLRLDNDYLRLNAPDLKFLAGKPLERLKDGNTVGYLGQLTVSTGTDRIVQGRSIIHFAISYDIWTERFKVTVIAPGAKAQPPARNLTLEAAQSWCLDQLRIDLAKIPIDRPIFVRVEMRSEDAQESRIIGEPGISLSGLIVLFSHPVKNQQIHVSEEIGPYKISDLRKPPLMNRLRNKLVLLFLGATIVPVLATVALTTALFNLSLTPSRDLEEISRSIELTGKEYYQQARQNLRSEALSETLKPTRFTLAQRGSWPESLNEFWDSGEAENFNRTGNSGDVLEYFRREPVGVAVYTKKLGVGMETLTEQYRKARALVENSKTHSLRGFTWVYIMLTALIWIASAAGLIYLASRISRPMEQLTAGLQDLARGSFDTRIEVLRNDEVGRATEAFNRTARQLEQNRDRLVYLTQLASWQVLARKMAHEVKNSLTPIRLTVEEMVARGRSEASEPNRAFLEQAAQIVVDEVESLGRRVRAFSELSSEPPVRPSTLDINAVLEERISFLKAAHPEVSYIVRLAEETPSAMADEDLVKSMLVNLLENAAEAAGSGGRILAFTKVVEGRIAIEVHDSGPGLSEQARRSLFQPTISFKKRGMGIGLSIARKGALLCGGDIQLVNAELGGGELGGAAFRVILPAA